jgi:hypothetical protein
VQLGLFYSVFQSFFVSEWMCIDKAGICLGTGFEVLLISDLLDFGGIDMMTWYWKLFWD